MSELSVLQFATVDRVALQPYAHLICAPALPEAAYGKLSAEFPDAALILGTRKTRGNAAARLPISKVAGNLEISEAWRAFFAYHTSAEFWREVVQVFGAALRETFPKIEEQAGRKLEDWRVAPRGFGEGGEVRLDCQFAINTPAARPSSVKTPHVDKRNTILSMLLYLRDPEDRSEGGDLEIYGWKRAPRFLPARMILPCDVELQHVVKYASNTLVAFVNSDVAPHAVSPRSRARLPRRYINFICETPFKAFDAPEIGLVQRIVYLPQLLKVGLRSAGDYEY